MPAILLHGIENRLCLKTRCLERRSGNVAPLRMSSEPKNRPLGIIDPVRRKQAAESRDEDTTAAVLDRGRHLADLGTVAEESEVVHEELDRRAGDGDGALERIDGRDVLPTEVVGDRRQQAVLGDDGLLADVVQQEAAGAVGVFGAAGREAALADEGGGLVAEYAADPEAFKGAAGELAVGVGVGGRDDLG